MRILVDIDNCTPAMTHESDPNASADIKVTPERLEVDYDELCCRRFDLHSHYFIVEAVH